MNLILILYDAYLTLFIRQGLRGDHWVLFNYIKARKEFQVSKSSVIIHTLGFNLKYSNVPNDPQSLDFIQFFSAMSP